MSAWRRSEDAAPKASAPSLAASSKPESGRRTAGRTGPARAPRVRLGGARAVVRKLAPTASSTAESGKALAVPDPDRTFLMTWPGFRKLALFGTFLFSFPANWRFFSFDF